MRILFLTPYPRGSAASQRFRFEQYYQLLDKKGIFYRRHSFIGLRTWQFLYQRRTFWLKFLGICNGFVRRFQMLFRVSKYDFVFIHREAEPVGLPIFEWIIAKVFKKRIIFDFDDAIWVSNASDTNWLMFYLKRFSNAKNVCKWAYKVSCGNQYLLDFAAQYNPNVSYIPTVVDIENYHNQIKQHNNKDFVIGWTGSHSTIRYLYMLLPVIEQLEKDFDFEFHVISDQEPDFKLRSLKYTRWKKESEIDDLLHFNVGLMPLTHDKWSEGKCGFKAIQYMALGIPALVSPIGVNTKIVDDGVNGFVCDTLEDWKAALIKLMNDRERLTKMAAQTRSKIEQYYSVKATEANFLKLFS